MARLTITVSEERHRALKETAARTGKTIGQIVDESLEFYGIKSKDRARLLVERARRNANLDSQRALDVALDETKAARDR
jgi:hypothetical protein